MKGKMNSQEILDALVQVAKADLDSKGEWGKFLISLDKINETMVLFGLINTVLERLPFWLSRVAGVNDTQKASLGSSEVFATDLIQQMSETYCAETEKTAKG